MHVKNIKILFVCIVVSLVLFCGKLTVCANVVYQNDNGFQVYISDDADLLTEQEEADLQKVMQPITEFGNVAFKTTANNASSTEYFSEAYYKELWGRESGTIFVIDMANRYLYIYSDGAVYRTITDAYADTITDNVYTYATNQQYYQCAAKTFEQIGTVLEGGKIAQPMKYASNAFLAVIISFIILYFWVKIVSASKKPSKSELLLGMQTLQSMGAVQARFTHETKTYSPQSSSSGGGGGSSGGGGGGGGGHSF